MPSRPRPDASAGYESAAAAFQLARETRRIGANAVASWARTLPPGTDVLELGCGAGIPVTEELARAGCVVWGIDASPTLLARFAARYPHFPRACDDLAVSNLFDRPFHAAIAIGVLFLLSPDTQRDLIARLGSSLAPGGEFLFTAPVPPAEWPDLLTGQRSQELGRDAYIAALRTAGLSLVREFEDEGGNHYYTTLPART